MALQMAFFAAMIAAGTLGRGWPSPARAWLYAAAGLVAVGGLCLFVGAAAGLGRQLTPYPKPVESGSLRRGGVYRLARHPMYGGVVLLTLAWALVSSPTVLLPWAGAVLFLDAKRRLEEAWLADHYDDYGDYRRSVRARLVPFVW